jgi:hypothetical protein
VALIVGPQVIAGAVADWYFSPADQFGKVRY